MRSSLKSILIFLISFLIASPVLAQSTFDWPMAGANPQRTSWVSTGPKGMLKGDWVKPIEPYISQKVQVVAAEGKIFLATAKGLYAFSAADGTQLWVYPTSMPLSHSPTYVNGILYLAGFDRKIHAITASNGQGKWTYIAEGGFNVNPLVVNGTVYAGSRDGYLYAVKDNGSSGSLVWKFKTGGPIMYSAAYADNTIYFGSDDMSAYAVNATTGTQVWKSAKLPGLGMHSWWPVVAGDFVYFTVAINFQGKLMGTERDYFFSGGGTSGTPYGAISYPGGQMTMDAKPLTKYLEDNPGRRTLIVLNRANGSEKTYDFNGNGKPEYAPALWGSMTGSMTRFPPIVDSTGTLYFRNHTYADGSIPGSHLTGWKEGTSSLLIASNREVGGNGDYPIDEPGAEAGGGSVVYHSHCCSRFMTNYDLSVPNNVPLAGGLLPVINPDTSNSRQWRAINWKVDGYESELKKFFMHVDQITANEWLYFAHADNNPPVPYNGKVYLHRGNALIAMSPSGVSTLKPKAASSSQPAYVSRPVSQLQSLLATEVQKIIAAGHLRPGLFTVGLHDNFMNDVEANFLDLFHNPSETYIILLRALPHLSASLQSQLRTYLQTEWNGGYAATNVKHSGFSAGTPREAHVLLESKTALLGKQTGVSLLNYYAAWKYAQEFGNAAGIFGAMPGLPAPLTNDEFAKRPQRLNEYIAGYKGYFELKKLATGQTDSTVQNTLNTLISQRTNSFSVFPPSALGTTGLRYYYATPLATNFLYIQPEFAQSLNSTGKAASAIASYETMFPFWFVAKGEEMQGEGTMQPPQYFHGLFQAKARILKQSYAQLEPFIDAPAFAVGDLYYIDNLVAAIEAACTTNCPTPPPTTPTPSGAPTGTPSFKSLLTNYLTNLFDQNSDGKLNSLDFLKVFN